MEPLISLKYKKIEKAEKSKEYMELLSTLKKFNTIL